MINIEIVIFHQYDTLDTYCIEMFDTFNIIHNLRPEPYGSVDFLHEPYLQLGSTMLHVLLMDLLTVDVEIYFFNFSPLIVL
jgi:hypothetical protein